MRSLIPVLWLVLSAALLISGPAHGQAPSLDIYLIDTEGGQATLFVAPSGQTALIDTGNPGARDIDRIMAVLAVANVRQIDHLVLTHYHVDHVGGVEELARRVPILNYVDHGPSAESTEAIARFEQAYATLHGRARHQVVRAGDRVDIGGWTGESSAPPGSLSRRPCPAVAVRTHSADRRCGRIPVPSSRTTRRWAA